MGVTQEANDWGGDLDAGIRAGDDAARAAVEAKRAAILGAALQCFAQYGLKRTSMEDIAKSAGMSRAALYLHYKNKRDIYRSLAQGYFDGVAAGVAAALGRGGSIGTALSRAFAAHADETFELILNSPHGGEMLDVTDSECGDIIETGEARLVALYASWLEGESTAGRVQLAAFGGAPELAATMLAALHGVKKSSRSYAELQAGAARLALIFGQGLTVQGLAL